MILGIKGMGLNNVTFVSITLLLFAEKRFKIVQGVEHVHNCEKFCGNLWILDICLAGLHKSFRKLYNLEKNMSVYLDNRPLFRGTAH